MSTKLARWVLWLSLFAMLSGCMEETTFEPTENTLIVESVLDTGKRHQYVLVQHTNGLISQQATVTGASVSIIAPSGATLAADEIVDSIATYPMGEMEPVYARRPIYRVSLDQYNHMLVPGGTYRLRVRVPGYADVTGETTIPAAATVTEPAKVDTLYRDRDTLSLTWPSAVGARTYQVTIGAFNQPRYSVFTDHSFRIAVNAY